MGKTTYYPKTSRMEKLSKEEQQDLAFDLINAFSLVRTPIESALLLNDLLTKKEIQNLAKRLRIAKLLIGGTKQEEIIEDLHCSYATVSRVKIWLNSAGAGLTRIISRLPAKTRAVKYQRVYPNPNLPVILAATIQHLLYTKDKKLIENFFAGLDEKNLLDKQVREYLKQEFSTFSTSLHRNVEKKKQITS